MVRLTGMNEVGWLAHPSQILFWVCILDRRPAVTVLDGRRQSLRQKMCRGMRQRMRQRLGPLPSVVSSFVIAVVQGPIRQRCLGAGYTLTAGAAARHVRGSSSSARLKVICASSEFDSIVGGMLTSEVGTLPRCFSTSS